jgi:serine/threonine protein kinase
VSTANDTRGLEDWLARKGPVAARPDGNLWREGREVGEWTVAGFVGRGGSAEVYCARHRRLGTAAVLKVLWRGDDAARARFDRETRFLMEGPGPSFPVFFGTGVEEGRPWLAMELLEEYPLPASDRAAAAYLLDVARGAEELHRRGWVHRDLKPRNILKRASDGHAVLVDFGLLKRAGEDAAAETAAGRTSPSVVDGREVGVGTPGYAAPEQFAGGAATPATDVHALGILADECFGGRPPRAWERIIRRATGSLPRQRYATAAAMAQAIRRRHWPRRAAWTLLACAAAALAAWWWASGRKPVPPPPPEPVPEREEVQPPPEKPGSPLDKDSMQSIVKEAAAYWDAQDEKDFRQAVKTMMYEW